MFRLEHIEYLAALAVIPICLMAFLWAWRQRRRMKERLGDRGLVADLLPGSSESRHTWKFILITCCMALLVVALANPQLGIKQEKVKRKGIDIVIALDLSRSMLAADPKPSRLERSRIFISSLIDRLQNDRVALVIFAGNAYLQMPLTVDYSASEMYLRNVNTEIIPTQGTAIGQAIRLAEEAFEAGQQKHKLLLIISDGESHDEDALKQAQAAAAEGTVIHTIGVGSSKGAPIPETDRYGNIQYKKDEKGSIILSRLNEPMMQQLAAAGNGEYFRLEGGRETIQAVMRHIEDIEKREIEELVYTDFEDQFQYFLFFGLVFLLFDFFLSAKKGGIMSKISLFDDK